MAVVVTSVWFRHRSKRMKRSGQEVKGMKEVFSGLAGIGASRHASSDPIKEKDDRVLISEVRCFACDNMS